MVQSAVTSGYPAFSVRPLALDFAHFGKLGILFSLSARQGCSMPTYLYALNNKPILFKDMISTTAVMWNSHEELLQNKYVTQKRK